MKWFKHYTTAGGSDQFMIRLKSKFGFEGYGRWWRIVELVAHECKFKGDCEAVFPLSWLCQDLAMTPRKWREYAVYIASVSNVEFSESDGEVHIKIPTLRKLHDNYTKDRGENLQESCKKLAPYKEVEEEVEEEEEKEKEKKKEKPPAELKHSEQVERVINHLGTILTKHGASGFQTWNKPSTSENPTSNARTVSARISELMDGKYTSFGGLESEQAADLLIAIIDKKSSDSWWMKKGYVNPTALFGRIEKGQFQSYVNEAVANGWKPERQDNGNEQVVRF